VARLWSDLRFLQMVVGLMDIAHALKVAEQRLQPHDISFVERGPIVSDLLQVLRHDVKQGEHFSALEKSLRQEGGSCTFRGITLTKGGTVLESLKKIRAALVDEIEKRLFNREILDKLGWLDVNEWPQDDNLTSHGKADLEAIFEHWKRRFSQLTWETICTEFEQIKVIFRTHLKLLNSRQFWSSIVCQKGQFPQFHILLRATLALTPSDAAVEQAFSRFTALLAPQRLSLSTKLVEQFMILALDALPWGKYDYQPVWSLVSNNERRARFRKARADQGGKHASHKRKTTQEVVGAKRKRDVVVCEGESSDDASSISDCNSSSDSE
jgi:hypothetical protein